MNEYQNIGENCAFLHCGPCRRYLYAGASQDIRSSSSHMYYYIVVLKSSKTHRNAPAPESLFNLQPSTSSEKTPAKTSVSFAKFFRNTFIMENLLRPGFERRILWKMDIVRENVSWRAIDRKLTLNLIVIFDSFTDIWFLQYVTKIFCISYFFQEKIWECFKVQLSVTLFVYILSSKGANQLQVLYIETLGNIQGNFSTEAAVLKCIPSIFSGNLQKFLG